MWNTLNVDRRTWLYNKNMNEKIAKEIDFKYLDNLLSTVEVKRFKYSKIDEKNQN